MNLICYACSQPANERREKIVDVENSHLGECWGMCHVCSIVICTEHGYRNTNPVEYECVYCVGPGFRKRKLRKGSPQDPTPTPETAQTLIDTYSRLKPGILAAIQKAIEDYQLQHDREDNGPLDEGAYLAAAEAFELATGAAAGAGLPGSNEEA